MTKAVRKRLLLCVLLLTVCIVIVINFLFWFIPYKKHRVNNTDAAESNIFLPMPESVLYISAEGTHRLLTDAEVAQIYAVFQALMNRVKSFRIEQYKCDGVVKVNSGKIIRTADVPRLEFRYAQRQRYIGTSPASAGHGYENALTYDAMMLLIYNSYIELIPYKGVGYVRNSSEHARMDFYANYYEFKMAVSVL